MTLGEKIRKIRNSKGLTQEDLAKLLDVRQGYISRLEADYYNNIGIMTARRIAQIFDITVDELIDGVE
jgi:transcriptional regulator with XRE-family HTH domain